MVEVRVVQDGCSAYVNDKAVGNTSKEIPRFYATLRSLNVFTVARH
jgi:hypothetical protein